MQGRRGIPEYTLRQLQYFVAAAEAGTVTQAAEAVHLSQSAMSTALADLEKAFQVQLLVRHHARGISLTPAGRELLVASRQLLAQAADLLGAAEGLGTSLTGTVQIGCFSVPAPYLLPELLATAAEQFPGLQVETTEVNLAELAEGVASGKFELGIGYDLIDDDRLTQDPLYSLPPYVLLPGSHRWAKRRSVRLAELAEEPMVLLDLPHSRDYFQRIFSSAGVTPTVRYRSASVETCRALVGRGLAYTVLNLRPEVSVSLDGHPVAAIFASPLERAQETAQPVADRLGLQIITDDRLIESGNVLEGKSVSLASLAVNPLNWKYLWNPVTPSWGEPYKQVAARVRQVIDRARDTARGKEAVCVSHQLPIWVSRLAAEHRRLWHNPNSRQCALGSVTSLTFDGDQLTGVSYAVPPRQQVADPDRAQ